MSAPLDREFLQTKAKQCRQLAETVRDPFIRERLQAIAFEYDHMATNHPDGFSPSMLADRLKSIQVYKSTRRWATRR